MATSRKRPRRLADTYTFPGFRPETTVCGIFGDPKARIVTLTRRSKKHSVAPAERSTRVGTTASGDGYGISPAVTPGSTSISRSGGYVADAVVR